MIYNLILIMFTVPQTLVTIGTYAREDCYEVRDKISIESDVGKVVCVPAREGWNSGQDSNSD